jgi:hypothetical protein
VCKEDKEGTVLIECMKCELGTHLSCLSPPLEQAPEGKASRSTRASRLDSSLVMQTIGTARLVPIRCRLQLWKPKSRKAKARKAKQRLHLRRRQKASVERTRRTRTTAQSKRSYPRSAAGGNQRSPRVQFKNLSGCNNLTQKRGKRQSKNVVCHFLVKLPFHGMS